MAIEAFEKPNYYNVVFKKVAKFPDSHGAGVMGADTNGVSIHTFTEDGFLATCKISSSDAANNYVYLYAKDGSTILPEANILVPLLSGVTTVPTVDGLANAAVSSRGDWIERNGKRVIPFKAGQELKASVQTAMGSGEEIYVTCVIFEKEPSV
jgi:hypothetical protein